MIYREPGFLASYDLTPPPPLPPSQVSKAYRRHTGKLTKRDKLLTGDEGRAWGRSPIIRRRESLVHNKSFDILCCAGSSGRSGCLVASCQSMEARSSAWMHRWARKIKMFCMKKHMKAKQSINDTEKLITGVEKMPVFFHLKVHKNENFLASILNFVLFQC
jgi:hypothetical protein